MTRANHSSTLAAAGILAVALVLRLTHVLTIHDYPLFEVLPLDSESYDSWARRIASGELARGRPFYQAPLYAYFLAGLHALSGGDLLFPRVVNAVLGTVHVALVLHLGRRTFGTAAGLLAGGLVAVHRTFLFEEGKIMKTTLGLVLAMATLVLLVEARRRSRTEGETARHASGWYFASGVTGAATALVRENFLLFVAAAAVWTAVRHRSRGFRPALMLAAGGIVGLLPSTLHNFAYDGELVPITAQAGQNFYTGVHVGNPHGGYLVPDFVRRSPRFEEMDFAAEARQRTGRDLTPGETSRYWLREGLRVLADEPLRGPRLFAKKLGLLIHRFEIPDDEDLRFFRKFAPVLRLPLPGFGLFGVLGLAGLALAWRRRVAPPEIALFVATYTTSVALFFVFSRYRLPLVGPLAIFAAYFMLEGLRAFRDGRRRDLLLGAMLCVPLVIVVYRPINGAVSFANSHLSVGIAYEVQGHPASALNEYRQGLSLEPGHPKLLKRTARILADVAATGSPDASIRIPEAEELLELLARAVVANPGDTELRFRYGTVLGGTGDLDGAVRQFEAILRRGEEPPGLHANLAIAYEVLGRSEDASHHARLALRTTPGDVEMKGILERAGRSR